MTLDELAIEYKDSGRKIREQLKMLRQAEREETEPGKLSDIRYRISVLTPVLTELNKQAERCATYYGSKNGSAEHGNGKCVERQRKRVRQRVAGESAETIHERRARDNAERINRETGRNCPSNPVRWKDDAGSGRIAERLQKYGL